MGTVTNSVALLVMGITPRSLPSITIPTTAATIELTTTTLPLVVPAGSAELVWTVIAPMANTINPRTGPNRNTPLAEYP